MDRDSTFCESFHPLLDQSDVEPVVLPARSPNLNAHLKRFFGSLKSECLDRMIFCGEQSLRNAIREFTAHDHGERNHQGLANRIIEPSDEVGQTEGVIAGKERLGGLLRYYHRQAEQRSFPFDAFTCWSSYAPIDGCGSSYPNSR